ncbi:hypothetical protein BS50DRAFT_280812 [Corynespora cassiicola Philippines]|uniref:Uncharacterized protein n=1 Tax=Corynespora cassiicola Philippines TaxID=1448308 RepID=A0A2T2P124_CORCC|nr:hypothetical protein BS50DRAFT_280812 [Corynespora cassiicola Philippines]
MNRALRFGSALLSPSAIHGQGDRSVSRWWSILRVRVRITQHTPGLSRTRRHFLTLSLSGPQSPFHPNQGSHLSASRGPWTADHLKGWRTGGFSRNRKRTQRKSLSACGPASAPTSTTCLPASLPSTNLPTLSIYLPSLCLETPFFFPPFPFPGQTKSFVSPPCGNIT